MRTLERIVCSALLGFVAFSASADSPKVVMKDDSKLIADTSYYNAKWENKENFVIPNSKIKITTMNYTGNSRGLTKVSVFGVNDKSHDFSVKLQSYGDNVDGSFSFQYLENVVKDAEFDDGLLFSNYFTNGSLRETLIVQPPKRFVKSSDDKNLWDKVKTDSSNWVKLLGFDDYKKRTEWKNARRFVEALPSFIDKSHYDISITHKDDDKSWVSPRVIAKLKAGLNDSVSFVDIENGYRKHVILEWNIKLAEDKNSKDITFQAEFVNNDDGSLNLLYLGHDKLETFSRGIAEPAYYLGEVKRPYSKDDNKAIFEAGEIIDKTINSCLVLEIENSKKSKVKSE